MRAALAIAAFACAASALPTAPEQRQALFFAEQRAGQIGYIGWPPKNCTVDADCSDIKGSYCVNDKTKVAPFFCHESPVFVKTGLARPVGVSIDQDTQTMYYNQDDQSAGDTYWPLSAIGMDGKNNKTLIDKLLDPQGLDAISSTKQIFYTEHHGQRVGVVNMDGTGQKVLAQFSGEQYPSDVKVDIKAGKIFLLVEGQTTVGGTLVRMNLDGSNKTVLKDDIVRAYGLTLDYENEVVYFINGGSGGFIGNMSYYPPASGPGSKSGVVLDGLDWPYMLDLDPVAKKLVFTTTEVGTAQINIVNTNGTEVVHALTLGFAYDAVCFGKVPLKY